MPNLLKYCCASPEAAVNPKMESTNEINGHHVIVPNNCPFSDSVEKPVKPNLKLSVKVPQPMKLINHLTEEESYDVLHSQLEDYTIVNSKCTEKVCGNSIMDIPHRGDIPRQPEEIYVDAEKFLRQYFQSIHRENSEAHKARLDEVKRELESRGTYQLKTSELVYGAKLAWRNASRCIMRIQWKKLQIFDCREVTTASGMFEALCNHIKYATNKGNIRSAMTIFPQRTDGKHDYRIWNPQLINYAGYLQPDGSVLGDSARVEITQVCIKLGWKPPYTAWDILPLVLSADGKDPEYFEYPPEIIKEIHFEHPKYEWFKDIGIRWYAVPAVSNMRLDCGGLEFTGNAFNGWYMGAEIGCRNLCDANRRNMTEIVAKKMGLDTNSNSSLWKDKALVEINIAVLHSFQRDNVSIVDHHTASDQFMKHLENENKIRGGCPADWIWLVPPMSGSIVPLFHQEMSLYFLRPSYDYQEPAWKTHQWSKSEGKRVHRKFHFKQIARAVKFTSKLFGRALSKRIKATILYATETGKSEQYAKELGTIFGHAFNAQVHCMSEYDMFSIEHETLLIIVTSTFGNGEPPANGVDFAEHLYKMLVNEKKLQGEEPLYSGSARIPTPKSLLRTNSSLSPSFEYKRQLTRLESNKSSIAATSSIDHIGPLSNVCYAVFALGSSTYPKFCNFGKTVDGILHDLGGERILDLACGDEIYGQEQQFKTWSSNIFHVACETFCLDESEMIKDAKKALTSMPLNEETVRFSKVSETMPIKNALESSFKKHLVTCKVRSNKYLGKYTDDRATIFVDLEPEVEIKYEPGDHLGVMPCNQKVIVDKVLNKLKEVNQYDFPVQLQTMKDTLTPTGSVKTWERYERIPPVSVRDIFTRFLDITTPPSTTLLKYLATTCTNEKEAQEMMELATDSHKYDDWRHHNHPHLAEVFEQFPSCRPQGSLLATLLPSLQHRFYSISSSPVEHKHRIHATVALVVYKTQNGNGPTHYGVCSNYLKSLKPGDEVFVFVRRAPNFHMPQDTSAPLILVGPGSGIAPFRGFWQHRRHQIKHAKPGQEFGPIWLFFGCRTCEMDLYKEEKEQAIADGVITKNILALSRDPNCDKKHVQILMEEEGEEIVRMLLTEDGHFYVCGDCKMAEEVQQKLKMLLRKHAQMTTLEVDDFIIELMDENRYHEDIFGITLRTAEVQSASREYAKRTRLSSSQSQP